jgi:hypothetical protein
MLRALLMFSAVSTPFWGFENFAFDEYSIDTDGRRDLLQSA